MRWLLRAAFALVLLGAAIYGVGAMLPREHLAARSAFVPAPPERVWQALVDVPRYPRWRTDVRAVTVLPARGGRAAWREVGDDVITYEQVALAPPTPGQAGTLVTCIADSTLPFGGEWQYDLHPEGRGTRLTITERGEVRAPAFRFLSHFVLGHTRTIDTYLAALGRAVGATVTPEPAVPTSGTVMMIDGGPPPSCPRHSGSPDGIYLDLPGRDGRPVPRAPAGVVEVAPTPHP